MPMQIIRNDITAMHVDAIVNATNTSLLSGGGVSGCIHAVAGPELSEACRKLGGCAVGEARITDGYHLPCRYIIHTVGPRWIDGQHAEKTLLASCYRSSLELAEVYGCNSVAFPLIASGVYGYPKDQALRVAVDTIGAFLAEHDMVVYLIIFDKSSYKIGKKLFADIAAYVDDHYTAPFEEMCNRRNYDLPSLESCAITAATKFSDMSGKKRRIAGRIEAETLQESMSAETLEGVLQNLDESFSEMLLRKIQEAGMSDARCYKLANIDRKLFSKIRSDKNYKPSKPTVIAFSLALRLPLPEMENFLRKAGFALSHANKFDVIVEYFVKQGIYDVFQINEALFAFDQALIGSV